MGKTLSFCKGKGNIRHNNRDYVTDNIDRDRIKDNVYIKQQDLTDAYRECFGKAIEEYNLHQLRADRKKSVEGYMDEIKKNQSDKTKPKLFYENVVMIGDMYDTGIKNAPTDAQKAREVLLDYANEWQRNNPNLHAFNIVLHMDEQTPHLHIDYIPVGKGYKQGLQARNSLTKAYEGMGIESAKSKTDNGMIHWQNRERERITQLCKAKGIEIDTLGVKRQDLSLSAFKERAIRQDRRIDKLKRVEPKRIKVLGLTIEKNPKEVDQALNRQFNLNFAKQNYNGAMKTIERERERMSLEHVHSLEKRIVDLEVKNASLSVDNDRLRAYIDEIEPLADKFKEMLEQAKQKVLEEHRERSAEKFLNGKSSVLEKAMEQARQQRIVDDLARQLNPVKSKGISLDR